MPLRALFLVINSFVNYINTRYAMESDGEGGARTVKKKNIDSMSALKTSVN